MKNTIFYKFIAIVDPNAAQREVAKMASALKGRILIAIEGINGCVSGTDEDIAAFQERLQEQYGEIDFKQGTATDHTFKKMFVRVREEIITFKQSVTPEQAAHYIEPQELKRALDDGEEIILLDARNTYESRIGRFKGAVIPNILFFSDLPKALENMPELKEKRIVTYCTGGIRCEKSSAWMRQNGFLDVKQLHGGIIRYGEQCGQAHWEGKCYVFDRRGAINIDPNNESAPITQCELCGTPNDDYHNCANCICDKFFLCCDACLKENSGCCGSACLETIERNPKIKVMTYLDEERPRQHHMNGLTQK